MASAADAAPSVMVVTLKEATFEDELPRAYFVAVQVQQWPSLLLLPTTALWHCLAACPFPPSKATSHVTPTRPLPCQLGKLKKQRTEVAAKSTAPQFKKREFRFPMGENIAGSPSTITPHTSTTRLQPPNMHQPLTNCTSTWAPLRLWSTTLASVARASWLAAQVWS